MSAKDSVLRTIPYDSWGGASEISIKTGISNHKVAGIIRGYLLYEFVERKRVRTQFGKNFNYKRLRWVV